ncbi:MAG: exo-alpha-sialidase [Acidobacteria bacterium]|nr:exo-alpha-sialidase [Acidobacteriota bacterium]
MRQDRRSFLAGVIGGMGALFGGPTLGDSRETKVSGLTFTTMVGPATIANPRNGEGSVIELRNGQLLLAYTEFYTAGYDDHAPARICGRISEDRGRSWGKKVELVSNESKCNVMSVSLLRLPSRQILMAYLRKDTAATQCQPWLRASADDGKSWSRPWHARALEGYLVLNNDRLVRLERSGGRLLAPVAVMNQLGSHDPYHCSSTCLYSDDEGQTWNRSKTVLELDAIQGLQEPGAVELKDGRVMMFSRTSKGHPYRSYSTDGGESWTSAEPVPDLVAPVSPQQIKRIPSTGDLLVIYNNNYDPAWANHPGPHGGRREPLTAAISRDDGKTWGLPRNIETHPEHQFDYPSIAFLRDEVLLTYH